MTKSEERELKKSMSNDKEFMTGTTQFVWGCIAIVTWTVMVSTLASIFVGLHGLLAILVGGLAFIPWIYYWAECPAPWEYAYDRVTRRRSTEFKEWLRGLRDGTL